MVAFRPWRFVNYRSGRKLRLIPRPPRKAERDAAAGLTDVLRRAACIRA